MLFIWKKTGMIFFFTVKIDYRLSLLITCLSIGVRNILRPRNKSGYKRALATRSWSITEAGGTVAVEEWRSRFLGEEISV